MTTGFTVSVEDRILTDLDKLAATTQRPRNHLIEEAIENYLLLQAWQMRKIEAGLAAADRKEFASDEEVARVLKKYAF